MMNIDLLIEMLEKDLKRHNYKIESDNNDDFFETIFKTNKFLGTRYLCGVITIPDNVTDIESFKQLYMSARKRLIKKYVKYPIFKNLGTYLIFLCSHKFYEEVSNEANQFKDRTGIHINVILGTAFVDEELFQHTTNSTWGLLYYGTHYKTILSNVDNWCKEQAKSSDLNSC